MRVRDSFAFSRTNQREENQDGILILNASFLPDSASNICICTVFDGVSSSNGGKATAFLRMSVYHAMCGLIYDTALFAEQLPKPCPVDELGAYVEDRLRRMMVDCNDLLHQKIDYGTTMSVAVMILDQIITANVGDSPIILFHNRRDGIERKDMYVCHNRAGELVREGRMTRDEAIHADEKNELLLGLNSERKLAYESIPTARATLGTDGLLLMGSDGALAVLKDSELEELVSSRFAYSMGNTSQELCQDIWAEISAREEADDNASLAVFRINVYE